MPKKKVIAEEASDVVESAEIAEETHVEATTKTAQRDDNLCYYVYTAQGEFVKFYTYEEHGVDAKKKAEAHAEEIGGSAIAYA